MIDIDSLRPAVIKMMQVNMNLQSGERVAFFTDVPHPADWGRLPAAELAATNQRAAMARDFFEIVKSEYPSCPAEFITYPMTAQHGSEPPRDVADKLLQTDVAMLMTTNSMSHTNTRSAACQAGARIASMPGIEAAMFAPGGPMAADYLWVASETNIWTYMLTHAAQVRLTTPFGSDLSFSISGRSGFADTGLIHKRGNFGNLPAGEAFTAPVEGTAEGRLVVPAGWYPGLKETMTLVFEAGFVTSVLGGGDVGDYFSDTFCFGDESKKHRRNCAELGIGTNPNAKKPDNVLEAEKILGTVHIAVGDSSHMGGVNPSDLHEDFVQAQPTLEVDGRKVLG